MKPIFSLTLVILAFLYLAPNFQVAEGEVADFTISGAVQLGDGSPLATTPLTLSGNQTGMVASAADGSYSFANLPEGFDYAVTPGEPAVDNPLEHLSAYDLLLIRRAILSIEPLNNPCQTLAADVNGSSTVPVGNPLNGVTTYDYVLIQQFILGYNSGLTPAWEFMPPDSNFYGALGQPSSVTLSNLSTDTQLDWLAIQAGDVSACGAPIVNIPDFLALEASDNLNVMPGSTVSVPIRVQNFADVMGLQFSINWDPAVLGYVSAGNFAPALSITTNNIGDVNAANGELRFTWFDTNVTGLVLPNGTTLFELTFNVVGPPGSASLVEVNATPLPVEVINSTMEVSGLTALAGAVSVAGSAIASISGNISRANGAPVPGITVDLTGNSNGQQITDNNGNYAFPGLDDGFDYTITPSWGGTCNSPCITLYDLYLIQQHILGNMPLSSPYALIAADANNSGSITALDYSIVRSMILGDINLYPDNLCWRFVDANYIFPNPANPFFEAWPEVGNINNLAGDVQVDFIGVQVGDVSDCVESVGVSNLLLDLDVNTPYCLGETALIQVRVQGFTSLTGLQFTLQWDPAVFEYVNVLNFGLPGLTAANFGQPGNSGQLTMVWTDASGAGQTLGDGSLLFNLYLNPIAPANTQSILFFADTPLPAQALDAMGQPGVAATGAALLSLEAPTLAIGPAYCYNGLQFVSLYSDGNISGSDGDNVFQDRGNNGSIVYNLTDNDPVFIVATSPTPPFCGTPYSNQLGACAEALVPDCEQPQELAADVEADGSLQVQGDKVVWVSDQDGDRDIYAYDLATGTTTNVSDNAADDQLPYVYGNSIVWRSNESGNYEIWHYDCLTQIKRQVSQNTTDVDQTPAVFGNYVVWRSNQDGDNEIYLYNLISQAEINISNDNATGAGSPAIFGDWVVWESTDEGPDVDVFLYSISTQSKQNLSNSPGDESGLRLQGDKAIWAVTNGGFTYDIFVYDLSTSTLIPVAAGQGLNPSDLDVNGNYAVWAASDGGDDEVFAFSLPAGPTLALSNNNDADNRPALHADQVVWEAFEGGEREIRYYNLSSGRESVLGPDPAADISPDTYGPFTVWQSDRDGNGQDELYFFNTQLLPPQAALLDAGASTISGLCPGDIATLVLETAGAGLEAVWFDDGLMSNELYASTDNLFEPTIAGSGTYYGAWRDPLTGCIAPLTAVPVDASPTDNLACNDMFFIPLDGLCQANLLDFGPILEGDLGCLQSGNFIITVQDGDPSNGPIIDGVGNFPYTVELAPGLTANFTGCFGLIDAVDMIAPVLTCPADITVQAPPGATEVSVNAPIPTWDDNCEVDVSTLLVTTPFNPSNPFPIGQTAMGFSIMDVSGNIGECSYIVEVAPSALDFTISAGSAIVTAGDMFCLPFTVDGFLDIAALAFTISFDPTVVEFDMAANFGLPGLNPTSFDEAPPGQIGFMWVDPDLSGENLPDGTILFDLCFTALMPGATDINFSGNIVPIEVINSSQELIPFNSNTGSITVAAPLVLECPSDIVQANDPGQCEAFVNIPVPALPGAGTLTNDYTGTIDASGVYPVGVTTVTYTFTAQPGGDISQCFFMVTIEDQELPIINCSPLIQVAGQAATGGATVVFSDPVVTDNCPMASWSCTYMSGDFFPCGETTVACTATDMSGNQGSCFFTVTVTCPTDSCCLNFNGVTIVNPINLVGGWADTGFDFIDADNDGDQDILEYNTLGALAVISNGPPYDPPNFQLFNPISLGYNSISPSTLDYNQDGFEDFFAIELGSNAVIYYENQGIIGTPAFNAIPIGLVLPPEATDIAVGDLGNDGIADLLVHTNGGGIVAVYYEGGCQAPATPCFSLAGNDYTTPFINLPAAPVTSINKFELFDGDCDGDLDLFMADGGALSPNPVVWYFENYGGVAPSGSLPDIENVNYLSNPFGLTGWASNSNATLLRLADVDNDQLAEAFLDAGDMIYFDNTCFLPPDFLCPGLVLTPTSAAPDSNLLGCCWNLDYSNMGNDSVYGIRLTPLDGIELSIHNINPAFMVPSTLNGVLITPDVLFVPMPPSVSGLADICLNHVLASPQYVAVQYLDENYEPFCYDTLVFDCPIEETCLYIVSDSLQCDTNGYKYVATVTNPVGADFPVKYIKLNITSGPPGLGLLPQAGIVLPDTLYQGDTTMVMWNIPTDEDWFGDTLCFILSAHDGPEERLCCAEIDTCLAFPICDPCVYKDVAVAISPLPGTGGGADCFGGDPLQEPWLQEIIADCASRPCGMLVYCCLFQGQPVVNVQDDNTSCTDSGGTVYDYQGNILFSYGGIAGINLNLFNQLENCTLLFECSQLGDCCYSLLISNDHPTPGFFTSIQTNILTPGITFSAVNFDLGSGWIYNPPLTGQSAYTWTHSSGGAPNVVDYRLFDFCIEGVTTTDSVCIEIQWQRNDSTLCRDTVKVYCPECVVITQEEVLCDTSGNYTYTFSGQNWSPYEVNAVGFVETSSDFDIVEEVVSLPGLVPTNGGFFGPLDITLLPTGAMDGDTLCFDIVLRQVVGDSINILCCYATHCIVLPSCDSIPPCDGLTCIPPPDVVAGCNAVPAFDPFNPADLQALFGTAAGGGNCPGATWQELPPVSNLVDCMGGTIVRTFQAFDASGAPSTNPCQQTVTITPGDPDYAIRFPADAVLDCDGLENETAEFQSSGCDLMAVTVSDEPFPPIGPECFRLARTYRVINWCEYDGQAAPVVVGRDEDCDGLAGEEDIWVLVRPGGLAYFDQDGNETNAIPAAGVRGVTCDGLANPAGYWVDSGIKPAIASVGHWQYTQFISVVDNTPPSINPGLFGAFCTNDNLNCTGPVEIPIEVNGVCLPDNSVIRTFLDLGRDGSFDAGVQLEPNGTLTTLSGVPGTVTITGAYPNYLITGTGIPLGAHQFMIEADDGCGNTGSTAIDFVMEDCLPPDLTCINGLAVELQPVSPPIDLDGDGDLDNAGILLFAVDFVIPPSTDCSGPVTYSINRVGQTPTPSQASLFVTCDDLGTVIVEIHAWDAAGNNMDCQTFILVQDTGVFCGPALGDAVRLQPNPAEGSLLVESSRRGRCELEILSLEGPRCRSQAAQFLGVPVRVSLEGLPPGMYLLRLRYADGDTVVRRFVKM